jgi:hypothetical protein
MDPFTRDQKIAMLVVPMLLFGMLGVSYTSIASRNTTLDEGQTLRRVEAQRMGGNRKEFDVELRAAIEGKNYEAFVLALRGTPYSESANPAVFDTLVRMYALHTAGDHKTATEHLHRGLYGDTSHIS